METAHLCYGLEKSRRPWVRTRNVGDESSS